MHGASATCVLQNVDSLLLDAAYPNNQLRHTLSKDLHVFGSYVTGHLPRAHPFVTDTTHDDRAVEGVWFGNDLCNVMGIRGIRGISKGYSGGLDSLVLYFDKNTIV